MKEDNVYDKAQHIVHEFERKYPAIAMRLNKDQMLTAAIMTTFTKSGESR